MDLFSKYDVVLTPQENTRSRTSSGTPSIVVPTGLPSRNRAWRAAPMASRAVGATRPAPRRLRHPRSRPFRFRPACTSWARSSRTRKTSSLPTPSSRPPISTRSTRRNSPDSGPAARPMHGHNGDGSWGRSPPAVGTKSPSDRKIGGAFSCHKLATPSLQKLYREKEPLFYVVVSNGLAPGRNRGRVFRSVFWKD